MIVNLGIPRSVFKKVLTELRLIREALERAYPKPEEIPDIKLRPGVRYDPQKDAIAERKRRLHAAAVEEAVTKK